MLIDAQADALVANRTPRKLIGQHALQVGAMHDGDLAARAELTALTHGCPNQPAPGRGPDSGRRTRPRRTADGPDTLPQAPRLGVAGRVALPRADARGLRRRDRIKCTKCIAPQRDAGARGRPWRRPFKGRHPVAGAVGGAGRDEPRDAGSDDNDVHSNPPWSRRPLQM